MASRDPCNAAAINTGTQVVEMRKPKANMVQQQHVRLPQVSQQFQLLYFGNEDSCILLRYIYTVPLQIIL
jgi:hypothetical protein